MEKFEINSFIIILGYDAHFLIKDVANEIDSQIDLIPINKAKYISFAKKVTYSQIKLKFIDSLRFMNSSLEKFAKIWMS